MVRVLLLVTMFAMGACSFPVQKQLADDVKKRPTKTAKFVNAKNYYTDKPAAKIEEVKAAPKPEVKEAEVKERVVYSEYIDSTPALEEKKTEEKEDVVFEYPNSKKSGVKSGFTAEVAEKIIPQDNDNLYNEIGLASWYGPRFHGRKTANGEIYNQNAMTAAHRKLPLGSVVEVTNVDNGKTITVRINDRGPYAGKRIIDLSKAAAEKLDIVHQGVAKVKVKQVE